MTLLRPQHSLLPINHMSTDESPFECKAGHRLDLGLEIFSQPSFLPSKRLTLSTPIANAVTGSSPPNAVAGSQMNLLSLRLHRPFVILFFCVDCRSEMPLPFRSALSKFSFSDSRDQSTGCSHPSTRLGGIKHTTTFTLYNRHEERLH